jgi:hypothetical protein
MNFCWDHRQTTTFPSQHWDSQILRISPRDNPIIHHNQYSTSAFPSVPYLTFPRFSLALCSRTWHLHSVATVVMRIRVAASPPYSHILHDFLLCKRQIASSWHLTTVSHDLDCQNTAQSHYQNIFYDLRRTPSSHPRASPPFHLPFLPCGTQQHGYSPPFRYPAFEPVSKPPNFLISLLSRFQPRPSFPRPSSKIPE